MADAEAKVVTCRDCYWWFWRDDVYPRAMREPDGTPFCTLRPAQAACRCCAPATPVAQPSSLDWHRYRNRRGMSFVVRRDRLTWRDLAAVLAGQEVTVHLPDDQHGGPDAAVIRRVNDRR